MFSPTQPQQLWTAGHVPLADAVSQVTSAHQCPVLCPSHVQTATVSVQRSSQGGLSFQKVISQMLAAGHKQKDLAGRLRETEISSQNIFLQTGRKHHSINWGCRIGVSTRHFYTRPNILADSNGHITLLEMVSVHISVRRTVMYLIKLILEIFDAFLLHQPVHQMV